MPRQTYSIPGKKLTSRMTLTLTPPMREYLRSIGNRCKGEGGAYMDATQILRALIGVLQVLEDGVDWSDITTDAQLEERLRQACAKRRRTRG